MLSWIKSIFGTAQSRMITRYQRYVQLVNLEEQKLLALSEEDIRKKTEEFCQRLEKGESLDFLLPEAYAVVKNACRRLCGVRFYVSEREQEWNMIPYDEQILGAIAMHYGSIIEMQTGEGKTLTACFPLYLNALSGKGVHLVTVNDYLARRDCEWMHPIFDFLGLTSGFLTSSTDSHLRQEIYRQDVIYGTASEFGFDYLRDHSYVQNAKEKVQRLPFFAIIDEVDSILIDEARTPLIISGPVRKGRRQLYEDLVSSVAHLVEKQKVLCQELSSKVEKEWQLLQSDEQIKGKERKKREKQLFQNLWLVYKGMPRNVVLKRMRENPEVREQLEAWDIYYYSEQNKQEKWEQLSQLYILVDEKNHEYELTDRGIEMWGNAPQISGEAEDFLLLDLGEEYGKVEEMAHLSEEDKSIQKGNLRERDLLQKERVHTVRQLLRALLLMERDVDYLVQKGKVIIIDENTGRPQPGRRFSDGLHQAIEAKEGVHVQAETQTHATVTLQNYFRLYEKLSGMTGTAITEEAEFKEIYSLGVLQVPTHAPYRRKDDHDEVYMTEREKYAAILREITTLHQQGRPILIGTGSVDISEKLSELLRKNRLQHTVLNAKYPEKEAEIIALAGKRGAITIATNMAGRGTDIKLAEGVEELGGLQIIGCSRHTSRRIDRQLRGRSGRQGDRGSSKFFISLEDSLMRYFSSPKMIAFMKKYRPPEGEPLISKWVDRAIETAQKRIEKRNYTARKYTFEFDNVMNKQRERIYGFRDEILEIEDPIHYVHSLIKESVSTAIENFFLEERSPSALQKWCSETFFMLSFPKTLFLEHRKREEVERELSEFLTQSFSEKVNREKKQWQEELEESTEEDILQNMRMQVRSLLLQKVDHLWKDHLLEMDLLRSEVSIRSLGQKDPLTEFKYEAFALFESLSLQLSTEVVQDLFHFPLVHPPNMGVKFYLDKLPVSLLSNFDEVKLSGKKGKEK